MNRSMSPAPQRREHIQIICQCEYNAKIFELQSIIQSQNCKIGNLIKRNQQLQLALNNVLEDKDCLVKEMTYLHNHISEVIGRNSTGQYLTKSATKQPQSIIKLQKMQDDCAEHAEYEDYVQHISRKMDIAISSSRDVLKRKNNLRTINTSLLSPIYSPQKKNSKNSQSQDTVELKIDIDAIQINSQKNSRHMSSRSKERLLEILSPYKTE